MNYMETTTQLACKAYLKEEIPVGAIIVKNKRVISKAFNTREKTQIATHHAEIIAIQKACKKLKSWRLDDCDLYVNLEPCPMCAGAIMNARIKNVFFAVIDESNGGFSRFKINENTMNHSTNIQQIKDFEEKNLKIIKNFFKNRRK